MDTLYLEQCLKPNSFDYFHYKNRGAAEKVLNDEFLGLPRSFRLFSKWLQNYFDLHWSSIEFAAELNLALKFLKNLLMKFSTKNKKPSG